MSPIAQTIVVMVLIIGALTYLATRAWRAVAAARARKAGGCGSDCGCD